MEIFCNFNVLFFLSETDELIEVVDYFETKSVVNPKEIALAKREEMKKKGEIKSPGKKPGRKSGLNSVKFHLHRVHVAMVCKVPSHSISTHYHENEVSC